MDSKLVNGDLVRCGDGFAAVSGQAELLQQALIRLAVPKGRFAPNPELGSRLYTLRTCARSQLTAQARALGNEALLPMGLEVASVNARTTETGLRLDYYIKGMDTEITVEI